MQTLGMIVLVALVVLTAVNVGPALGQVPKQLSYQGVLTDTAGAPMPDNTYVMVFRLYTVAGAGTALWTEVKNVPVKDGIFSTYLGDTTPIPDSITWTTTYWLGIQVGGDPELAPRVKMVSSAYSLNPGGANSYWVRDSTTGYLHYDGGLVLIGRDFRISGNEAFGVRYSAGPGVYGGMYMETENAGGWPFYGYATAGSFRAWTYYNGQDGDWRLYNAGVRLTVPNEGGLRIGPSVDYSLVIENTTGSDGIRVLATGDDAIQLGSSPDAQNYGVYIPSPGVTTYGLWPNTQNALGEWALYTVDNIQAGNVFSASYTLIAKVTGTDALSEGDVVSAVGASEPVPGSQPSLSMVRPADDLRFTGLVGVVKSRMVYAVAPGKEEEGEMSMHSEPGPAEPGDYVSLVIAGVANVKVAAGVSVTAGQRLTVGESGAVRALKSRVINGMT
ncbi:MAG TPA: hypothetical protein VI932_12120, partial [Bacteroidota bacterium]|nr:hypothetical protein [Bacteroidota bacterium]